MTERHSKHNERVAIHEAGHSLLPNYLGLKLTKSTIVKNEKTGAEGETFTPPFEPMIADEDRIAYLMAGIEAVKVAGCEKTISIEGADVSDDVVEARSDIIEARKIAQNSYPGSELLQDVLFLSGRTKAEVILEGYIDALKAIAAPLIEKHTLSGEEIAKLIESHPPSSGNL